MEALRRFRHARYHMGKGICGRFAVFMFNLCENLYFASIPTDVNIGSVQNRLGRGEMYHMIGISTSIIYSVLVYECIKSTTRKKCNITFTFDAISIFRLFFLEA